MDLSTSVGRGFDTRIPRSTSEKSLERTDTPSTVCDEEESSSSNSVGIAIRPSIPALHGHHRAMTYQMGSMKPGRGLNCHEFLVAVKSPFLFPSLRSSPQQHATPVCIICTKALLPGNVCRELMGCGHCFHARCVEQYFHSHSRCPVCRLRCRSSRRSISNRNQSSVRPCWTPDYDTELLSSNRAHHRPFFGSALPTLLEESEEVLNADDGSLLVLCQYLNRERERRIFSSMPSWNRDMRKLAVTFTVSLMSTLNYQLQYVSELTRLYCRMKRHFPKHYIYNNREASM